MTTDAAALTAHLETGRLLTDVLRCVVQDAAANGHAQDLVVKALVGAVTQIVCDRFGADHAAFLFQQVVEECHRGDDFAGRA